MDEEHSSLFGYSICHRISISLQLDLLRSLLDVKVINKVAPVWKVIFLIPNEALVHHLHSSSLVSFEAFLAHLADSASSYGFDCELALSSLALDI